MKTISKCILAFLLVVSFGIAPAYATVIFNASGTTGHGINAYDVTFEASLSISEGEGTTPDMFTLVLKNTSENTLHAFVQGHPKDSLLAD